MAEFDDPDPGIEGMVAGFYTISILGPSDWSWSCTGPSAASDERTWLNEPIADPHASQCDEEAHAYTVTLYEETTHVVTVPQRNPNVWVVAEPFNDTNNDGERAGNEKRLVQWDAELWLPGGTLPVMTAVTGNNGLAVFYFNPGTAPGTVNSYIVKLRQPGDSDLDWKPTPATGSTPPAKGGTPAIAEASVIAGESGTARAGFIQFGTISVMVFHDQDNDRVYDDFESPLANRNVRLYDRNGKSLLAYKATNSQGYAAFQVAAGVDFQLQVLEPEGWVTTTPLARNGSPTNVVRVTSSSDPTKSVDPVEFGQYQVLDITPPPTPTATPPGGSYGSMQYVTLESEAKAVMRYTLDGSTPSTSSTLYQGPITVAISLTLKAIAIDAAGNVSGVMTETYVIGAPALSATYAATAFSIQKGSLISGAAAQLAADDGDYLVLGSVKRGRYQAVEWTGSASIPGDQMNVVAMMIYYDGGASSGGLSRTFYLYNFTTSSWEKLISQTQTAADMSATIGVNGDPKRFVAGNGEVRLQTVVTGSASFQLKADLLSFTIEYQP